MNRATPIEIIDRNIQVNATPMAWVDEGSRIACAIADEIMALRAPAAAVPESPADKKGGAS